MAKNRKKKFFYWLEKLILKNKKNQQIKKEKQDKMITKNNIQPLRNIIDIIPDKFTKGENLYSQADKEKKIIHQTLDTKVTGINILSNQKTASFIQNKKKSVKTNFLSQLKHSLLKTRQNMGVGFINFFRGKKIDQILFDKLEEQLLMADVGLETTRKIIHSLTNHVTNKELDDAVILYNKLRTKMAQILSVVEKPLIIENKLPYIILIVGVNGVGKTTTIGKLAYKYKKEGKLVMLAAGDTFRAAAVEQLQVLGQRHNIPVIAQHTHADPASVIFDAIQSAKAKGIDILIADTAGRLQNKLHLMEELKKIIRVIQKNDQNAPHEIILTLDATIGQNSINQVKIFHDAIDLTGIILTKLDGTAKGGVIFAIADQFRIPIRYIGIGENIGDLLPFVANNFIDALFIQDIKD